MVSYAESHYTECHFAECHGAKYAVSFQLKLGISASIRKESYENLTLKNDKIPTLAHKKATKKLLISKIPALRLILRRS